VTATLVRRSRLAKAINVSPPTIPALVRKGVIPPPLPGTNYWVLEAVIRKLAGEGPSEAAPASAFDEWKQRRAARSH